MKPREIKVKNLGKIKNLKAMLPESGLVLVNGKNNIGKSTFIRSISTMLAAKSPNNMLTVGESNGHVEQVIQAANGDEYIFRMDLDPTNKQDRFTLLNPNGKVSKRISDIKDFCGYNDFTVEDFMDFGKTDEGARKQADIVLNLFPAEVQKQYKSLSKDEDESYKERTYIGRKVKDAEGAVKKAEPTTEEKQEAELYKTLIEDEQQIEEELNSFKDTSIIENNILHITDKMNDCEKKVVSLREDYKACSDEIERLEALIAVQKSKQNDIKKEAEEYKNAVEAYRKNLAAENKKLEEFDTNKKEQLSDKLENVRKQISEAIVCKDRVDNYNELVQEYNELKKQYEAEEARLKDIRFTKKNLMTQALPISNLVIEDGILFYEDDGNLFRFNSNETATSKLIFKTIEIILAINKKMEVVLISRGGGDMDKFTLKALHELGVDKDSLFIMEMISDNDEIQVVGYEELE